MTLSLRSFILLLLALSVTQAATLPVAEDFELTGGGFSTTSTNAWKWGPPATSSGPSSAHSGTQVWGTNINGSYPSNLNAVLVSPAYDLSTAAGKSILLHWWQFLVTEEGFDFADVQVSKNDGGTWETVFGPRHGIVDDQWTQHTVLLDPSYATSTFRVRFRLITDSDVAEGGFFIDDIRISAAAFSPVVPVQDFETDAGGYTEAGANSSWEHGTPVSAPGGAFSGSSAWATNLTGFYQTNESSVLTSPVMNLSAAVGKLLAVAWWQFFDTEEGYDFLELEVSGDSGGSWQTALIQSGEVSASGWSRMQVFLPPSYATAGFQVRFRFDSDEAYQYDGVAIDDIQILAAADVFPTVASFAKSAPENFLISFARDNFASGYSDPDGGKFEAIRVEQLPAAGVLKLAAVPVVANQVITASDLDSLTYEPPSNSTGSWFFTYRSANFFALSAPGTVTLSILGPTPQVVIAEHPQPATVNPGTQVVLSVTAISSLPLSYQWRLDGGDIENATGPTLTLNSIAEAQEGVYDVVVLNSGDSETSAGALVSVNDPVVIVNEPDDSFVNEGGEITFMVDATGTGRLDYQWFKNGEALLNETFPSLQITDAGDHHTGNYRCRIGNVAGTKETAAFHFKVRLAPRIVSNPAPVGIRRFNPARFEVVVAGDGPFTYQWYHNDRAIPGATGALFIIEKPTDANMGTYKVKVSNAWASVESDPVEFQVLFWRDVTGFYQDVLERPGAASDQSAFPGIVTFNLGTWRSFSSKLTHDGKTYRLSGRLNYATLTYERTFESRGQSPVHVSLKFNPLAKTVSFTVTQNVPGGASTSTALLPRHVYHKYSNPAPQQGRYTVLAEADGSQPDAPQAPAYLMGVIGKDGKARLAGKLPSGRSIVSSTRIHNTNRLPFYAGLGKAGQLCGRLLFVPQAGAMVVNGGVVWRHLPSASATFMPNDFVADLVADGSLYTAPASDQAVLTLPLGADLFDLHIEGPFTGGALQNWVRLSSFNLFRMIPETDDKIRLSLSRRTGFISGSFVDVGTRKRHELKGVVNQFRQSLGGHFKTPTQPGRFEMSPLLQ